MDKYYIIPSAATYYDIIEANSKAQAIQTFADNMDFNMAAYFDATTEAPKNILHTYKDPDNSFETRMACIIDTMYDDRTSPYYLSNANRDALIHDMNKLTALQTAYETIKPHSNKEIYDHFGEILKELTERALQDEHGRDMISEHIFEEKSNDNHGILRLFTDDLDAATACLDEKCIPYDIDSGDRLMIECQDIDDATYALEEAGINAYEV